LPFLAGNTVDLLVGTEDKYLPLLLYDSLEVPALARARGANRVEASVENQHIATRRRLLAWFFWSATSLVAAGLGIPWIDYLLGPLLKGTQPTKIRLGRVEEFVVGIPQRVEVSFCRVSGWVTEEARQIAWVVRHPGDPPSFDVFDPHCTHLGCAYDWATDAKQFQCPCHNGRFNINGCVTGGPPPRPLDMYPYDVSEGILYAIPAPQKRDSCRSARS